MIAIPSVIPHHSILPPLVILISSSSEDPARTSGDLDMEMVESCKGTNTRLDGVQLRTVTAAVK
ncbi:hypothetical protein HDU96_009596 [Phlyctochytrium bullatum]|nr:hypothetical protein HDU96_009596 [Phlyctochytrium bullatum]